MNLCSYTLSKYNVDVHICSSTYAFPPGPTPRGRRRAGCESNGGRYPLSDPKLPGAGNGPGNPGTPGKPGIPPSGLEGGAAN